VTDPQAARPRRYRIPAQTCRVEQTVDKSRFIATLGPARTVEEARAFVARVSNKFPNATHNCWAYLVGPPGDTRRAGMSDAGEPPGTAGRPMLAALVGSGIGDIVAVVTRYFGGRKLGRGGLVRAYGGAVKHALEVLPTTDYVPAVEVTIAAPYAAIYRLKSLLPAHEAAVLDESYGTSVVLRLAVPEDRIDGFLEAARGITDGKAEITLGRRNPDVPTSPPTDEGA